MGDFQSVFGSGACGADIADGYSSSEARYEREEIRNDEIIEHLIWFHDYETAVRWEERRRGKTFMRRRLQGGYEVSIMARRGDRNKLRNTEYIETRVSTSELLLLPELAEHEITSGSCCVRLAPLCDPLLSAHYQFLLSRTPTGRMLLNPTYICVKDFEASFINKAQPLAYSVDLPGGYVAMFSPDHCMMIGLRDGRDITLWPWVLKLSCDEMLLENPRRGHCFLCDHYNDREDFILSHRYDPTWDEPEDPIYPHAISKSIMDDDKWSKDLSHCLSEWITLLSTYDPLLNDGFQAPASGLMEIRDFSEIRLKMNDWCTVLSRMIAAHDPGDCDVTVTFGLKNSSSFLPQHSPGEMEFSLKKNISSPGLIPTSHSFRCTEVVTEDSFIGPIPTWSDVVRASVPSSDYRPSLTCYDTTLGTGRFTTKGLSAHQKLTALQSSLESIGDNVPDTISEFLKSGYSTKITDGRIIQPGSRARST